MTRYERLKGFKKGDKVWVSAIDFTTEFLKRKKWKNSISSQRRENIFPKTFRNYCKEK